MPVHPPLYPPGGAHPLPGRLVVVDRGPVARGPWGFHQGPVPTAAQIREDNEMLEAINDEISAPRTSVQQTFEDNSSSSLKHS